MNLIINIDEKDFEIMKHNIAIDNPLCPISQKEMVTKIVNGIPLDNLRAEIEQAKTYTCKTEDGQEFIASADNIINPDKRYFTSGLDKALEIINKYSR